MIICRDKETGKFRKHNWSGWKKTDKGRENRCLYCGHKQEMSESSWLMRKHYERVLLNTVLPQLMTRFPNKLMKHRHNKPSRFRRYGATA